MDESLDQLLETTYSDSFRKLMRQINKEWQKLLEYKIYLSAKEDEFLTAKDKMMHLKEKDDQNKKYLDATEKRIGNMKLCNSTLKVKLTNLKNEEERVAKLYREKLVRLEESVTLHQKKWRERCESHYSKNPALRVKEKTIKLIGELKVNLEALDNEYEKCERKLFQAKSEQNERSADEKSLYPFKEFVVKIAEMYLEARDAFRTCEIQKKISAEKSSIKEVSGREEVQKAKQNQVNLEKSETVCSHLESFDERESKVVNISPNEIAECNTNGEGSVVGSEQGIYERNTADKGGIEEQNSKCIQNSPLKYKNINQSTSPKSTKWTSKNLEKKGTTLYTKETKVRKWMERLKIYVPTFSPVTEEKKINEAEENEIIPNFTEVTETNIESKENDKDLLPDKLNKVSGDNILKDIVLSKKKDTLCLMNKEPVTEPANKQNVFKPSARDRELRNASNNQNLPVKSSCTDTSSKYFKKFSFESNSKNWMISSPDKKKEHELIVPDVDEQNAVNNSMDIDLPKVSGNFEEAMNIDEEIGRKQYSPDKRLGNVQTKTAKENSEVNARLAKSMDRNENIKLGLKNIDSDVSSSIQKDKNAYKGKIAFEKMDVCESSKCEEVMKGISNKPIPNTNTSTVIEQNVHNENDKQHNPNPPDPVTYQSFNNKKIDNIKSTPTENIKNTQSPKEKKIEKKQISPAAKTTNSPISKPQALQKDAIDSLNFADMSSKTLNLEQAPKTDETVPQIAPAKNSNPKTPLTMEVQNSTEAAPGTSSSDFASFKHPIASPGFAYTTRLMYQQPNDSANNNETAGTSASNVQSNMFARLGFFGDMNFSAVHSPDEDKMEFLAAAYEDYLADSPPTIKGAEKAMFMSSDNSPEIQGKDFFPLFGGGESSKDTKDDAAPFSFNFGGSNKAESPEENSSFKFLF